MKKYYFIGRAVAKGANDSGQEGDLWPPTLLEYATV